MADDSPKSVGNGVLGHLPPLPRRALSNSFLAMEQASRQREGLPLLTDADIEALKAGRPMSWESGDAAPTPATTGPPPTPPPSTTAASPAAPPAVAAATTTAPSAGISEQVAKWVAAGKKWSKSAIAAEQAGRGRSGLPALNDAEVAALLGEPVAPAAAAPTAPPAATAASAPRPAAPTSAPAPRPAAATVTASAAASVARSGESTRYVGTPAVGTSKAAASGGVASVGPEDNEVNQQRRRLAWSAIAAFLTAWFIAFFRFFLPRTLFEPATSFKIGYPEEFGLGVDTKFQQKYRIWVDRTPDRLFVIYARCTHLGCTPDWKAGENKFKCPCHGSGYDSEGVNFEGPAPRPMDRAHIERSPDGQILVDVSRLYQWPKGQPSQFNDDGSYLPL
ncbi:MAG TPA: Rieske 2Fe-2S domain-containing protein [Terriglobales bacterium]|nr:Rieske 2Fe-2S domain-containing protein [Terriglobales bacterium]